MKLFPLFVLSLIFANSTFSQTKKFQIAAGLSATANHTPGSKVVQVLMPGIEAIELDLTQSGNNTFVIKTVDFNFDGFKDFAFTSVNTNNGIVVFDIFIYHAEEKTFEALEVPGGICEVFGNVRLNAGDKSLKSACRNGGKMSQDIYKWTSPTSLELVKSIDNSLETMQENAEEKAEEKAEKNSEKTDIKMEKAEKLKDKKAEKKAAKDDGDN